MYNIYAMWIKEDKYDDAKIYEMLYPSEHKDMYKYIMPTRRYTL